MIKGVRRDANHRRALQRLWHKGNLGNLVIVTTNSDPLLTVGNDCHQRRVKSAQALAHKGKLSRVGFEPTTLCLKMGESGICSGLAHVPALMSNVVPLPAAVTHGDAFLRRTHRHRLGEGGRNDVPVWSWSV